MQGVRKAPTRKSQEGGKSSPLFQEGKQTLLGSLFRVLEGGPEEPREVGEACSSP